MPLLKGQNGLKSDGRDLSFGSNQDLIYLINSFLRIYFFLFKFCVSLVLIITNSNLFCLLTLIIHRAACELTILIVNSYKFKN